MLLYLLVPDLEAKSGSFELEGYHWALEPHDLEADDVMEPVFTCISYSWGPERELSPLRIDFDISDRTLPALATAIKHRPSCKRVWIDALSVPEEPQERARCLGSMGYIYSLAKEVLAVFSSGAQKALEQMSKSDHIDHDSLHDLEKEDWISRAWTYQEAVNSKKLYITCEGSHGALVAGNHFMNCVGNTLSRLKGSNFDKEQQFPSLYAFQELIADYMLAGYEERSALHVMSNMDKRASSRPDDHFYAMMGAISTTPADFSGRTDPCEAFMALCESKGDYSFIYSAAKRDPAFMRRWRPVVGDLPSILPWHGPGAGQPGHKEGSVLYLDFMMTFRRSPIEEDGERFVREWLSTINPTNTQLQLPLHHSAYTFLQTMGFRGSSECVSTANGYFFPLEPMKSNDVVVLVATKVSWEFGAPGLAFIDELNERVYIPGVFVGYIDEKDSTSVRMILEEPIHSLSRPVCGSLGIGRARRKNVGNHCIDAGLQNERQPNISYCADGQSPSEQTLLPKKAELSYLQEFSIAIPITTSDPPDMADQDAAASQNKPAGSAGPAGPTATKPPRPPNPVFKMMGLPNFRLRLPSRNWMIFLTITGSWTAALVYDRREKKRVQKKWAKLVSHIAQEPLDAQTMPRKVTIYLSAPPADGLMSARDHFHEYVKPMLVAAALDWDAVEGRREGDVRAGLAERIRKLRKTRGEESAEPLEEDLDVVLAQTRQKSGVKTWDGPAGDIIIGRNTWKEYIRGLHEGWLGPLDPPESPTDAAQETTSSNTLETTTPEQPTSTEFSTDTASTPVDDASPTAPVTPPVTPEAEKPAEEESKKPAKKNQLPPFNTTASYGTSVISPNCPLELPPSTTIPFPHLLGFLNTPIRMYRFLNRRHLADDIGRQTAAAVLAVYQPYGSPGESHLNPKSNSLPSGEESNDSASQWEQQRQLRHEEAEWHKSVRERKDDDGEERVWLDDIVLDPRIAERMRKFELDSEHEERARKISAEIGDPWWRGVWAKGKQEKKGSNQWGDEVE